ncbi:glycosyltransferase family 4 protein [Haliscomenobacter sp.]|uniref:glycosyltransferase family 4 protein n=1 Tax=Haliscomenobacter sp. TaxID=2717303 RepID=UPI003593F8BE
MQVILSHSGKQHAYQVAKSLHELGYLAKFYTSSYISHRALQQWLLAQGNQFWTRRFVEGLHGNVVDSNWRFEIKELVLRKLQGKSAAVQQAVYDRDVAFDGYVAKKITKSDAAIYWGFQGSSLFSLKAANDRGKVSICELASAHIIAAKQILGEEVRLHPEWADSINNLVFPAAYEQRLVEEPHTASIVISASDFTTQTLLEDGIPLGKIVQLPLGFEVRHIPYQELSKTDITNRPLRLLYAGRITQGKGIKYLLEAVRQMSASEVTLHLIGGIQGSGRALENYKGIFTYHSPVNQLSLFKQYQQYDALVLPSIFEGFGLVIVEALAAGLPVITTSHTFGPNIIQEGKNGYLVPIRNVPALVTALQKLRALNADHYLQMRLAARQSALAYSWDQYQTRLQQFLTTLK